MNFEDWTTGEKTAYLLDKLGAPPQNKGYAYIIRAVELTVEERTIRLITKDLYPRIAKEFKTEGARVERAIRHEIKKVFTCGPLKVVNALFNSSVITTAGVVTNATFIATLASLITFSKHHPIWTGEIQ